MLCDSRLLATKIGEFQLATELKMIFFIKPAKIKDKNLCHLSPNQSMLRHLRLQRVQGA